MNTRGLIRSHIGALADGELFTTRDLLEYGLRASIDQLMHLMVKTEQLVRLARGVFMKPTPEGVPYPSAQKIAAAKAKAFGKEIHTDGADAAHRMKLAPAGNKNTTFTVNGRTTSFFSVRGRITLRGTTAKDIRKGNTPVGIIVRTLKHLGKNKLTDEVIERVMSGLMRTERNKLRRDVKWMTAWIGDAFIRFWFGARPYPKAA